MNLVDAISEYYDKHPNDPQPDWVNTGLATIVYCSQMFTKSEINNIASRLYKTRTSALKRKEIL